MSLVIGCGTHLGKQQPTFAHLRCCGIKKACARIQNKWNQKMWDDFEKTLSKLGIPVPSSKPRKKDSNNETEENEVSPEDLFLIAQEIIKIETPLKPKYFSMNTKIYNAYLAKKGPEDPDVIAWGSLKQQKNSKKQKKRSKEGKSPQNIDEDDIEPVTNVNTHVNQSPPLRTLSKPPTRVTASQTPGGLTMIEGFFLRSSPSSNPSYPRPVIKFLEDILPEEVEYWECSEEDLWRAEIYIEAMDLDEVEFKRGKFIVKELSVIEKLPQEETDNANSLFGLPIEIVTPGRSNARTASSPKTPEAIEPNSPSLKKSPSAAAARTTRSKAAQQQKESPSQDTSPKRQKIEK